MFSSDGLGLGVIIYGEREEIKQGEQSIGVFCFFLEQENFD
ncbi:MAG: hypothetical protein ACRC10_06710 [Thermoguttaceae bacterium]